MKYITERLRFISKRKCQLPPCHTAHLRLLLLFCSWTMCYCIFMTMEIKVQIQHPESWNTGIVKKHPKQTSKTPPQASRNLVLMELEPLDITNDPGSFCLLAGQMHVRDLTTREKNSRWPTSGHVNYLCLIWKQVLKPMGIYSELFFLVTIFWKKVAGFPSHLHSSVLCTFIWTSCSGQVNSCVLCTCKKANIFKYHALSYLLTQCRMQTFQTSAGN